MSQNPRQKYRVDVATGLPDTGYVVVEARSVQGAKIIVENMVKNLELTRDDDRILYDSVKDPRVLGGRLARDGEELEVPING